MFTHEGRDLVDSTEIANAFNTFFANIGKNLPHELIKIMLLQITNNI